MLNRQNLRIKNKAPAVDNSPETIKHMRTKMHKAAIAAFNSKYFDVDELVRVQDELDAASTQEEINALVAEHHFRVMDQFQAKMVADLAEKMAAINE